MSLPTLPQTDSIQELARFWDTHDVTDFEDQLQEVPEGAFERVPVFSIELPRKAAESIRSLAELRGVSQAELIRQWVLEKAAGV